MSLVLTKAALALKKSESNIEVVKFEAHKTNKKPSTHKIESVKSINNEKYKDLDLKKIRHEVVKFGMSGFDPIKKQEARVALAVSLGAKPRKGKYVNYKQLIQQQKEQKSKIEQEKQNMLFKTKMQTAKTKKKSAGNDVGYFLSNYGKVQKKDVEKVSNATRKKKNKKSYNSYLVFIYLLPF